MADNKNVLTAAEAERKIQTILDKANVTIHPYCQNRMKQRNYVDSDIEFLLHTGRVRNPPEYDSKHKNWKCRVEGRIEGEETTLAVAFPSDNELLCITIFFEYT